MIRLWDVHSGEPIYTFQCIGNVFTCAFNPLGEILAATDSGGNVYMLELIGFETKSIVITAAEGNLGLEARCPSCQHLHPVTHDQLGAELTCPISSCGLRLKINPFLVVDLPKEVTRSAQADHLRRKGEQLLNAWELAQAVDCFDQALDLLPDDLTLLDLKARTLLESGDIQGGLDIISYVRKKDLASKDYLGKLYGAVGFALGAIGGEAFEDALEYYQMASALVPGDWDVWYYQGLANYRMGYYEDALDCLQRAKEIDDNEETNSLIDSCYEEIEELNFDQSIIEERPTDVTHLQPSPTLQTADDLYKKGTQLFNSGDFEGALDCFEAVLKQQPENPEALLMHLSTLLRLERRQETIQAADQVLENRLASGKNLAIVYYLKGCAQISLRQFEQGLESLGQSLKLDDENVAAWTIRAQAYSELKDYQAALECYLRVRELEWSEETEAMIGMYYLNLNDTESAEATFKSLIEEGSTYPLSIFGYGLCLVMMDKPEQGCMWLRRFLDDPGDKYQELVPQAHQVVEKFS